MCKDSALASEIEWVYFAEIFSEYFIIASEETSIKASLSVSSGKTTFSITAALSCSASSYMCSLFSINNSLIYLSSALGAITGFTAFTNSSLYIKE